MTHIMDYTVYCACMYECKCVWDEERAYEWGSCDLALWEPPRDYRVTGGNTLEKMVQRKNQGHEMRWLKRTEILLDEVIQGRSVQKRES